MGAKGEDGRWLDNIKRSALSGSLVLPGHTFDKFARPASALKVVHSFATGSGALRRRPPQPPPPTACGSEGQDTM